MLQFVLGLASGVILSLLLRFVEPLERMVSRLGRRLANDTGCDVYISSDHAQIWAATPPQWMTWSFRVPRRVLEQEPPADLRAWQSWVKARGGVDLWESQVEVTLVGNAPVTVFVHPPVVHATTAELPPGVNIYRPASGGPDVSVRTFEVDLDASGAASPLITRRELGWEDMGPTPARWSLAKGEAETVLIHVSSSEERLISWTAYLPVVVDGRRREIEISDDGAPFIFAGGRLEDAQVWLGPDR